MDLPLLADDALAQPTRAQIFAFLVEKRGAATTDELAERFGLHPNGIRRHLERLREGGFVTRGQLRQAHGRPKDNWTVSSDASPGGRRPAAYADLATWLAGTIPVNAFRLREVETAGREIGRELAPEPGTDPGEDLRDAFAALGFEPTLEHTEDGFLCCLSNCPYRDSARKNPEVVCTLHRGITAGLLAELDPKAKLASFEPSDPESAGCRVEVRGQS